MATKIASAGGGNWQEGGTWVGGVAPVEGDDVEFTASSGNVTIPGGITTATLKSFETTSGYNKTLAFTGTGKMVVGTTAPRVGGPVFAWGASSKLTFETGTTVIQIRPPFAGTARVKIENNELMPTLILGQIGFARSEINFETGFRCWELFNEGTGSEPVVFQGNVESTKGFAFFEKIIVKPGSHTLTSLVGENNNALIVGPEAKFEPETSKFVIAGASEEFRYIKMENASSKLLNELEVNVGSFYFATNAEVETLVLNTKGFAGGTQFSNGVLLTVGSITSNAESGSHANLFPTNPANKWKLKRKDEARIELTNIGLENCEAEGTGSPKGVAHGVGRHLNFGGNVNWRFPEEENFQGRFNAIGRMI